MPALHTPSNAITANSDQTYFHTDLDPLAASRTGIPESGYGAAVTLGPCTLYPSVIHFRTRPPAGIGPKPYTDCKGVRVTSIRQETRLEYEWYAWWKLALTKPGGNTGESRYTQRNVQFNCVGTESTVWGATTSGTVVYRGKTFYARVYQKMRRLACGA